MLNDDEVFFDSSPKFSFIWFAVAYFCNSVHCFKLELTMKVHDFPLHNHVYILEYNDVMTKYYI